MLWLIRQFTRPLMLAHLILHIGDYVTKAILINNLNSNIEGNFLAHCIIESYGLIGLGVFKLVILVIITSIIVYMYYKDKVRHGFLILLLSIILTSIAITISTLGMLKLL